MPTTLADRAFYELPLPIFGFCLLLALVLAMWLGDALRNLWVARRSDGQAAQRDDIVSAAIGLLALLLGFTFSMAVDRYDVRRSLVSEEANAISTAYLMAQTFEEPHKTRISEILVDYVDQRLTVAREHDVERARQLLLENDRLKARFWAAALSATTTRRDDIASSFLQAGSSMLEVAGRREGARRAVIPSAVHLVTIAFLLITAAVMGSGHKEGTPKVNLAMLLMLTLMMLMIISLDRPTTGQLQESQSAMELLRDELKIDTPAELQRLQAAWESAGTPAP